MHMYKCFFAFAKWSKFGNVAFKHTSIHYFTTSNVLTLYTKEHWGAGDFQSNIYIFFHIDSKYLDCTEYMRFIKCLLL